MLKLAVYFLMLAYEELTPWQAYASIVRAINYDRFGKYSIDQLLSM